MQVDKDDGCAGNGPSNFEGSGASYGTATGIPPPPDTVSMKQFRKQSTMAAGVASGLTGFLIAGPIVGTIAGFAGAVITKKNMKKREKKTIEQYQRDLADLLSPAS